MNKNDTSLTFEEVSRFIETVTKIVGTRKIREMANDPERAKAFFAKPLSVEEVKELPVDVLFRTKPTTSAQMLVKLGACTLGQLTQWSIHELRLIPGFGDAKVSRIVNGMKANGLALADHGYEHVVGMPVASFIPSMDNVFRPTPSYLTDTEQFLANSNVHTIGDLANVTLDAVETAEKIPGRDRARLIELIKALNKPVT